MKIILIIFLSLLSFPAQTKELSALEELEQLFSAKTVNLDEFLAIRDAAVGIGKFNNLYWKKRFSEDPVKPHLGTAILVRNAQIRMKHKLKSPPRKISSTKAEILDSSLYPIRVIWENPSWADIAQETLIAAEESWEKQINQWGFYAPSIDTESGRYEFYIEETGMGGGAYTAPYAEVPDTERSDCYTYIVIDPANEISQVKVAVTHEFQHALQAGMDCNEYIAFWENCATYIQVEMYPENTSWANAFLSEFQANPNVSVSGGDYELLPYYWYGAYFWPLFLSYTYSAPESAPVLIRKIWEQSIQNTQSNSINYLEATNVVLNDLDTDIQTAYRDFAVSRLFVGPLSANSLATMHLASSWTYIPEFTGEIPAAKHLTIFPSNEKQPYPFGANYFTIKPTIMSDRRETIIQFSGNENRNWQVLIVDSENGTINTNDILSGVGEISIDSGIEQDLYLIVINNENLILDPETYFNSSSYEMTISPVGVEFTITDASPLVMEPGESYQMAISGQEFLPGAQATFDSTAISVVHTEFVSENSLIAHVSVSDLATDTDITLSVLNADNMEADFSGLSIKKEKPENGADEGCSCKVASKGNRFNTILLVFSLLFLLIKRRSLHTQQ